MGAAMVKRSEAVQLECEALLDLVADIGELAQRIQAAARVVVILDELSLQGHSRGEMAYHRACIDALSKL